MTTVVVTGLGAITPLGADVTQTWDGLRNGRSGVSTIDEEWATQLSVRFAGQVDADLSDAVPRVEARRMDRCSVLAVASAQQAWEDAGFTFAPDNETDPERLGVALGTGIGGLQTTISQWELLRTKGLRRVSPFTVPMLMSNAPAAHVELKIGARAGAHTTVSACASSNEAIALGVDTIQLGRADIMLVGGTEALIHPLPIVAFAQMQALSKRNDEPAGASRPWDKGRDGFVLGEGAVTLVLESLESAKARGAKIYGTIAGAGISADAFDMVKPSPHGQMAAMRKALESAQISASDLNHINAHATSTPAGDLAEAHGIRELLGDEADHVVVTSTKSMTGHLLGAAGALESVATLLALRERLVPPTINLDDPEDDLRIDIAAKQARPLPAEGPLAAINNSFGFGGHNVAVAITNENATD
ncbi:3-oxoacyl-[acyl-carrier-protein] synthase II [Propionibacterium cyclohexanicum]|uniref:3-oxoacyl-[acyl-carrier-protein] synthase 2 n=1 Tax=Propionibacterium cyclohexanicum TaxID=64702 RepID=A0A1H9R6S8_9ACTN|nr:beta-ketoacyl-ACP synthase II [Propionibacterium cyclohexanicum]SER68317.1 3-oxoacyl-[acyl-carrier-protein] synthase II [Propionibacterium cyclohexanicum]